MMKRKIGFVSIVAAGLLCLTFGIALAGSALDYGTVPGTPAVGQVNWTAWLTKNIQPAGYPSEILTEDNTNSDLGVDQGYQSLGGVIRWIMQVENSTNEQVNDMVQIYLGGLGASSGNVWQDSFNWDTSTSSTNNGEASLLNSTACPQITSLSSSGTTYTFTWSGVSGAYYVYMSTQPSGAGNSASNGRYAYLASVSAPSGSGTYTHTCTAPDGCWYLVIHANSSGNIDGCHSEELSPTAVVIADFAATGKAGYIMVDWLTALEIDLSQFNIYRSTSLDGTKQKLNDTPIPVSYPGGWGGEYAFEDHTALPWVRYYYWLESVDLGGSPTMHDPDDAIFYAFWMPILSR